MSFFGDVTEPYSTTTGFNPLTESPLLPTVKRGHQLGLAVLGIIFIIVFAILLWCNYKYSQAPNNSNVNNGYKIGNYIFWIVCAIILLLAVLFVISLLTGFGKPKALRLE